MYDNSTGEQEQQIALAYPNRSPSRATARDLLAALFRHKTAVFSCFAALLGLALVVALLWPAKYQSEAKLLVQHQRLDLPVTPGAERVEARENDVSPEELNSELELLRSADSLQEVVRRCALAGQTGTQRQSPRDSAEALAALRSGLKLDVVRRSNVIAVAYASAHPDLSQRVIQNVVSLYLDKHVAAHSPRELDFFDQQVSQYKKQLDAAEAALEHFPERKGGVVAPGTERDSTLQKQSEFEANLQQTRSAIAETAQRVHELEKQALNVSPRITTQLRSADNPQLLQDLKGTLLKLQLKRTDLVSKYQPDYPPVQEIDEEIVKTRGAIAAAENSPLRDQTTDVNPIHQWIDSELVKAKADLRPLESREIELQRSVSDYNRQAHLLNRQYLEYQDLVRTAKLAEDNYQLYLRKREESRISRSLDEKRILNVAVVQPPTFPYLPQHSKVVFLTIGVVFAFVSTAVLLYGLVSMDTTFSSSRQLEERLPIPVLACIPRDRVLAITDSGEAR